MCLYFQSLSLRHHIVESFFLNPVWKLLLSNQVFILFILDWSSYAYFCCGPINFSINFLFFFFFFDWLLLLTKYFFVISFRGSFITTTICYVSGCIQVYRTHLWLITIYCDIISCHIMYKNFTIAYFYFFPSGPLSYSYFYIF